MVDISGQHDSGGRDFRGREERHGTPVYCGGLQTRRAQPDADARRTGPQVMRNAGSIGIDLEPMIDNDLVRLYYDPPQEIEVDQHFHRIEQIVHEFRPRRVVLDSISTYGSTLG